jgi:hypothetical protein
MKNVAARSLAFVDNGEYPAISFVLDNGENFFVQITGHQIVLLNEELAKYTAKIFRGESTG